VAPARSGGYSAPVGRLRNIRLLVTYSVLQDGGPTDMLR
jgi:hypothetical protein